MTTVEGGADWYDDASCARASRRRAADLSSEWPDYVPAVALSVGPLGAVQAADREIARQTALRARAVAAFAASRPASADRAQGEPGAMSPDRWAGRPEVLLEVSEWAAPELVVALSISSEAAETLLARSLTLVHRLPRTLAALEAGALHPGHLHPMLEKVAPIQDATVRAQVEAGLLRWAAGRVATPAQLGARARREVARCDARAAARQLEKAIAERGVHLRPASTDGMAMVTALMTEPEAQVLHRALGAYADAVADDPDAPRTRGQKMADCLLDLVLRPGEAEMPPVQVLLTVVASLGTLAGSDEPGEVGGQVVPAEMVRQLLRLLGPGEPSALLRPELTAPPCAEQVAPAGSEPALSVAEPEGRCPEPRWQQVEQEELERWWAELERRVLAEEVGPEPERSPDRAPDFATFVDLEPPGCDVFDTGPLGHDAGADTHARAACGEDPPERDSPDPTRGSTDRTGRAVESGWRAVADGAVVDAAQALRQADQALAHARRLVRTASAADAADEDAWQAGAGRIKDAEDAVALLRACTDEQRRQLGHLLSATGGGGLAERPRLALTDAVSGALLALTGMPAMRRTGTCGNRACRRDPGCCMHDLTDRPGLGAPGPTDGYRPSAALDRWVRARDRRCRFPGCRRRVPRGGELDHDRPYPAGETSATNLVGYCTSDHRRKHQAPGWQHALAADGTLTVTTPTGLVARTTPPPY